MTEYKNSENRQNRPERNRDRLSIHQNRLLDNFVRGVESGYTHENWVGISYLYKQVSSFLAPEEYAVLGKLWRESYSIDYDSTRLVTAISLIKNRIEASLGRNY